MRNGSIDKEKTITDLKVDKIMDRHLLEEETSGQKAPGERHTLPVTRCQ